jgi:peptidoglycan/LPS O-acetylase OafA/YrhL
MYQGSEERNIGLNAGWLRSLLVPAPLGPRIAGVLDMTRWVAAALVLVTHIRHNVVVDPAMVAPEAAGPGASLFYLLTDVGAQAVIWFFVLSGFLVGGSVVSDMQRGRFDFGRYIRNRAVRLYVVLLPALTAGYGLDLLRISLIGMDAAAGGESPASYGPWPFLANILCLQTIFAPTLGSNSPLWSLACEGWYYVAFPLLAAPLMTNRSLAGRTALVLLGLLVVALLLQNPRIVRLFLLWCIGVAARLSPAAPFRARLLAWALAVLAFVAYPILLGPIGSSASIVVALAFAGALVAEAYAQDATPVPWHRVHAALAGFAFSLYVTHAPVLHLILAALRGSADPRLQLQPEGWLPWAWGGGLFVAVVAHAWAFGQLTEARTSQARAALARLVGRAKQRFGGCPTDRGCAPH